MRTRRSQSSGNPVPSSGEVHRPVLLHEAIEALDIRPTDTVVDATLGGAGHARAIAELLDARGSFVGVDADPDALVRARGALAGLAPSVELIEGNFRDLRELLAARGIHRIHKALFDLGWSSYQLGAGRGFSFRSDEPLRMTYSPRASVTAETAVNEWSETSLADIIYGFGDERYARRIARAIAEARRTRRITTARELANIVVAAVPPAARRGATHPATKTFQALRIAVNDEFTALEMGLQGAWELLRPGGRIAIISFHSGEDRIVKRRFADWESRGEGTRLTKRPVRPSAEEVSDNPRARSAKLRAVQKN